MQKILNIFLEFFFGNDNDVKFQEAYAKDAQAAGYTLEQALQKKSQIDEEEKKKNSTQNAT